MLRDRHVFRRPGNRGLPLEESPTPAPPTRWLPIWLAVIAGVVSALHVGKLPPALPAIRAELELGMAAGGWVFSVFSITGLAFGIFAGTVTDRFGHWRTLLAGLGVAVVGSALGSVAADSAILLFSRFLEGVGFILVAVSAPSYISEFASGKDRRLALSLWSAYVPAGTALTMALAPLALETAGWRPLWQILAVATVVWIIVFAVAARPAPRPPGDAPVSAALGHNIRATVTRPEPWLLAGPFALFTFQFAILLVWLPTFLIEARGMAASTAALLTALFVAVNVPGNLLGGWLLHRGAGYWTVILCAGVLMALSATAILAPNLPDMARYLACLSLSFFGGMLPATAMAGVPRFAPSRAQTGTTNGLVAQGANTGLVIGPPVAGALVAATGNWQALLWPMVAASTGIVILALVLRRFEKTGAPRPTRPAGPGGSP